MREIGKLSAEMFVCGWLTHNDIFVPFLVRLMMLDELWQVGERDRKNSHFELEGSGAVENLMKIG